MKIEEGIELRLFTTLGTLPSASIARETRSWAGSSLRVRSPERPAARSG